MGNCLSIIGVLILLFATYFGLTHLNTWHDEIFSMWITNLPLNEFFQAVIADVHPPLYYLIYKFFIKFFLLFNIKNYTFIGKIVSLIPMYLLVLISFIKVRKNFGSLVSGLFIFSIITMPLFIKYALEVRMYSWTILFLTTSFIYIYEIIKNPSNKNWAILIFLSICSFYTQYFSALSTVVLFSLFLVYILSKNRSLLKKWIISVAIIIAAYIPWIPIAISQFTIGQKGFWIPPITSDTVMGYVYGVFSPVSQFEIAGIIFLIVLICLVVYSLKNIDELNCFALNGILAFVLVPIIGITVSYLFFPIFHIRYLLPLLGTFWLSISILISRLRDNKKLFVIFICIILIVGALSAINGINNEQMDFDDTVHKNETLQSVVGSNNIVIFDNNVLYLDFGTYYLRANYCYIVDDGNPTLQIMDLLNDSSIQEKIKNGAKVYYIDCHSDGYNPNHDQFTNTSISLVEVYSSNPDEYIRDFTIYQIII